jgi:hypothetical protein
LAHSKEKTEKRNKSRRNLKRRKEKASPREKQTTPPHKGAAIEVNSQIENHIIK